MSDEDSTLRAVALPAGAPIRVTQWLMAPVVLLVLGAIETYLSVTDASGSSRVFSIVAATIFFAAAVALSVYGYLAYRELTPAAVARHRRSKIVSLCVVGVVLSFGTHSIGFILMTWAGLLWADDLRRRGRTSHRPIPRRVWTWVAVATAVITLACELLLPLALGIGSLPLIVAMIAGRIIAPFAFGVAFRLRWGAYGVL